MHGASGIFVGAFEQTVETDFFKVVHTGCFKTLVPKDSTGFLC